MKQSIILRLLFLFICITSFAQTPRKPSSSEIYHDLQKLNFLGSALYIAAHPDDENTRLISYLVNEVHAHTAYLSLTRGDGGQNLIGPELREQLGVIRTEELMEARKVDGGSQFFSRANDFGFSKNPDETFQFWDKQEVLSDVVRIIRQFKPDVIINRFDHRSPGTTHGHHTASAILSMEAFDIVNNPSEFPKTAKAFGTWKPKRIFFNTSWWFYGSQEKFDAADKSNLIQVEIGNYFPTLGYSNGEIAALSRSKHKSQGFGSTGTRGTETEYLEILKGKKPANNNLFEGINTTWSRIEGGEKIGAILIPLEEKFDFTDPSAILPQLLKAYSLINDLKDEHWKKIKLEQITQLILNCNGIFLEAVSKENSANPEQNYKVTIEAISRGNFPVEIKAIKKGEKNILQKDLLLLKNEGHKIDFTLNSASRYSTPYWLENTGTIGMYSAPEQMIGLPLTPESEKLIFELQIEDKIIPVERKVVYKFNDPVKGEVYRPLEILPEVTSSLSEKVMIFPDNSPTETSVLVRAGKDSISGILKLKVPLGWKTEPEEEKFDLYRKGATRVLNFKIFPPEQQSEGYAQAIITVDGKDYNKELFTIDYDHIPYQNVLLPSQAKIVKIDISKRGKDIGYINGAADAIPESLRQIGYHVSTIDPDKISEGFLSQFDAIVIGIRAYNTVPELAYKQAALNNYIKNGGTVVVQYNTNHALVSEQLAPYPLTLSRDRVTDESSEVKFLAPQHSLLNYPNKITSKDFEGWVQERGLYFPSKWAPEFTPILEMKDKGEEETKGSLLVAKYGKGYYIYTGLSFFRELPAGVPGAFRLFANMLSIGK